MCFDVSGVWLAAPRGDALAVNTSHNGPTNETDVLGAIKWAVSDYRILPTAMTLVASSMQKYGISNIDTI